MPLSATGKKVLKKFMSEYGKKEGKSVFYAKENKGGAFARAVIGKKRKRQS